MLRSHLYYYSDAYIALKGRTTVEVDNDDKTRNNEHIIFIKRAQQMSTPNDSNTLDSEIVVSLTSLCIFWRFFDLPLINCEIELNLLYLKYQ